MPTRAPSIDFVGVYPTGFASQAEHVSQLDDGPTVASFSITDARLIDVSPSAAMLCYRADYRPLHDGQVGDDETLYISSLWTERDGQWQNIFSQDTPASAGS